MKSKVAKLFIVSASLAIVYFGATAVIEKRGNSLATFVITETGKFTSLDPLDGDSSQNLPVARMLYATPLEIFADNTLGSRVLESFSYDQNKRQISWFVKSDAKYSDGTMITPDDIAFAVSRMAFSRPGFPVIRLIVGVQDWLKSTQPLKSFPSGIIVEGNKITIQLMEDYPHPLFRFCLEIFSIIPRKCVDPVTNKINCENIPTSGYYELTENADNSLLFRRRADLKEIQGKNYPDRIQILYKDVQSAFFDQTSQGEKTVTLSSESKVTQQQLREIEKKFTVGYTPAAWFTILQINPNVKPFDTAECRFEFAEVFRSNFKKLTGEDSESSVFTKVVAGYKSHQEMLSEKDVTKSSPDSIIRCRQIFSNTKLPWGFDKSTPESFIATLKMTFQELGIQTVDPIQFKDRREEVENFSSGNSPIMYGRTGFWALDPSGDIQMLFTPNLHKGLKHFWEDKTLQTTLNKVVSNGKINMEAVDSANTHLFSDAKFNVYSHIRRFYASTNNDLVKNLPIGITSPSPWHLFGDK